MSLIPLVKKLITPKGWKWVLLVFLLLILPGVLAPYHSDDYFQLLVLREGSSLERQDASLFGLFSFIDDVPSHRQQMQNYGVLPWFAAKDFSFRFWRPLTEITHWLDYRLFGLNPLTAHVHSVLWFLLLAWVFFRLAHYTLPEKTIVPKLALLIFLWDGQHVANIGWIANRNSLLAACFAMGCLYMHMQWRDRRNTVFLLVSCFCWIAALLSGELALGGLSFLFFYGLLLDRSGSLRGLMSMSPYFLITGMWFIAYRHFDFGVNTSAGLYVDPLHEPVEFLMAVLCRIPVYFSASLLPVPSGFSWVTGSKYAWMSTVFISISVMVLLSFIYMFRGRLVADRVFLFWVLSSAGAILPVCSTMAQDRLALLQTIGMDMVLAMLVYPALIRGQETGKLDMRLAYVLLFVHLVMSPVHLLAGSVYMNWGSNNILANALSFPDTEWRGRHVMVLRAPIGEVVVLPGIREVMGRVMPESLAWLSNDEGKLRITRISEEEFILEKPLGFANGFEAAFRSVEKQPFTEDERISLGNVEIVVEHINDRGFPDRIKVITGKKEWIYYTYKSNHYVEVAMPKPGEELVLY